MVTERRWTRRRWPGWSSPFRRLAAEAPAHATPARPQPVGTSVTTVHNMPGKFQSDIVLAAPRWPATIPDFTRCAWPTRSWVASA
ncbi:MAG: hypothetical protein R2838_18060 [Caldilineaceae bacterium]